jgi:hypothetical protein
MDMAFLSFGDEMVQNGKKKEKLMGKAAESYSSSPVD